MKGGEGDLRRREEKQKKMKKTTSPSSSLPDWSCVQEPLATQGQFVYVLHKLAALQRQRKHYDSPKTSG